MLEVLIDIVLNFFIIIPIKVVFIIIVLAISTAITLLLLYSLAKGFSWLIDKL